MKRLFVKKPLGITAYSVSKMALAKRSVELFYDVLSPYSWVAFEVSL